MLFTPTRRLAAGATAAAILAGAFLIPAAVVAAEELPDEAAATASSEAVVPASDAAPDPASTPQDSERVPETASEPSGAAAPASAEAPPQGARAAVLVPYTDQIRIEAGDSWTGAVAVDAPYAARLAVLGPHIQATISDGRTQTATRAGDGSLELELFTYDDITELTVIIRNTGTTAATFPYAVGWTSHGISTLPNLPQGRPELTVGLSTKTGTAAAAATGSALVVDAAGTERVKALTGVPGYYQAVFPSLPVGTYLVHTEAIIDGVHRYTADIARVAAAETTPPTVTVDTAPQPGAGGWYPGPVTVTVAASDDGAGVRYLSWGLDTTTLSTTGAASTSFLVSAEGPHQVNYRAEDWQGNTSALATRQIDIDATAPTLTLNGVADGERFDQDEVVAIEYLCDDALSGIQSCVGDVASGDFLDTTVPGPHSIRVTATDKAGNETVVERGYTVLEPDTTDPEIVVDVPPVPASGWYLDTVTVRLTASDESGIRRIHYEYATMQGVVREDVEADTAELTFDRSQFYTLSYWAEDTAGNRSEGRDLQLYVDAAAPWVNLMSPDQDELSILPNGHVAQNERIVVDFSCDDDASGIESCDATTPAGELLPTGTPGVHELRLVATDVAGHRTERVVRYTVDAAPAGGANGAGTPRLASTGADGVLTGAVVAGLLLTAGAALAVRRRVRER